MNNEENNLKAKRKMSGGHLVGLFLVKILQQMKMTGDLMVVSGMAIARNRRIFSDFNLILFESWY